MISHQHTGITPNSAVRGLELFGTLGITFDQWLDFMDQWGQPTWAAVNKRLYGNERYYLDGVKVGEEKDDRTGQPTVTATQLGRLACAVHVFLQAGAHVAATVAITRLFGYRIPLAAVLTGAAINGPLHFALDRGDLLQKLAARFDKTGYLERLKVVRKEGDEPDQHGAGTAWCELDRSAHRAIGWFATAVTVYLALKIGARR